MPRFSGRGLRPLLLAFLLTPTAVAAAPDAPVGEREGGVTTERIVVDRMTGFAIGGYDPVAYFDLGRPVDGQSGIEASWDGAIWRFANTGDRDAFLDAPDLYAPQFGGHCAMAAAGGIAAEGDPRIFAIFGGRLYLFRLESDRERWLAAPRPLIAAATRKWPGLIKTLAE